MHTRWCLESWWLLYWCLLYWCLTPRRLFRRRSLDEHGRQHPTNQERSNQVPKAWADIFRDGRRIQDHEADERIQKRMYKDGKGRDARLSVQAELPSLGLDLVEEECAEPGPELVAQPGHEGAERRHGLLDELAAIAAEGRLDSEADVAVGIDADQEDGELDDGQRDPEAEEQDDGGQEEVADVV